MEVKSIPSLDDTSTLASSIERLRIEAESTTTWDDNLNASDTLSTSDTILSATSSTDTFTRPVTSYNRFLERLKDPSCIDIVRAVKGLIVMLPGNMKRKEVAAIAHNFIDVYTNKLLSLEIFQEIGDEERQQVIENFEKFTVQKLYKACYRMEEKDAREDEKLEIQIKCLDWVELKHLEISIDVDEDILKDAQNQLKNISKYKAPKDKMIAILNCCRLIVYAVEKPNDSKTVSADEAFPLLIYTVIKTNPRELYSSIEFIQNFRHPSRHISEEAYAFTLLVSAVEYIRSIGNSSHLKLNRKEFNNLYNERRSLYIQRLEELEDTKEEHVSVIDQFKRFTIPNLLFKVPLFNRNTKELAEIVEILNELESYINDLPLSYEYDDKTPVSPALLSDWKVLIAMRQHIMKNIAKMLNITNKLM